MNRELLKKARELEEYYSQFPDWYWRSLHDAEIISFETEENLQDYKNDRHNRFSIYLDTSNALGDRSVKKIHFYNYKFLKSPQINFAENSQHWWIDDTLKQEKNGIYKMKIILDEDEIIEFSFKQIEVVRNKNTNY